MAAHQLRQRTFAGSEQAAAREYKHLAGQVQGFFEWIPALVGSRACKRNLILDYKDGQSLPTNRLDIDLLAARPP